MASDASAITDAPDECSIFSYNLGDVPDLVGVDVGPFGGNNLVRVKWLETIDRDLALAGEATIESIFHVAGCTAGGPEVCVTIIVTRAV